MVVLVCSEGCRGGRCKGFRFLEKFEVKALNYQRTRRLIDAGLTHGDGTACSCSCSVAGSNEKNGY